MPTLGSTDSRHLDCGQGFSWPGTDNAFALMMPYADTAAMQASDALDRVQFGRVGGQRNERDVGWNRKRVRAMPARLIKHHHGMLILSKRLGNAVEEALSQGALPLASAARRL